MFGTTRGDHFREDLGQVDPEIHAVIADEYRASRDRISLIASENFASRAVCQVLGGILTNTTTEGYPGARYLGGAETADRIERLAVERARKLFGCEFANVQPHSGSQMNQAVLLALLDPGDTILSMETACGGHLSHGARSNLSGRLFRVVRYGVDRASGLIDYDEVRTVAREHRPRLLIAGGSSYPRPIDFARLRIIADEVGSSLLVDMSHFAGPVIAGIYPDPLPAADVVTTTTYKSLRGPRGGVLLTNSPDLARRLDAAVTPGIQDSPAVHHLAAKAVCFHEASQPRFRDHVAAAVGNARVLGERLGRRGYRVVTGGTDLSFVLLDLRARGLTGDVASTRLEAAGIVVNKNQIPYDPTGPRVTSGIRLGANAGTTRGLGPAEFHRLAELVADVLDVVARDRSGDERIEERVRGEVRELCRRFPFYESPDGSAET